MLNKGGLIISLDFELYWGVRDSRRLADYQKHILGEWTAIPKILTLFKEFHIHATWATVGFLFTHSKDELKANQPRTLPHYTNKLLSPYEYMNTIGDNEAADPYHYAPSLIKMILQHPEQRIGSHSFSHYYCLEEGQTIDSFKADLSQAIEIAKQNNVSLSSFVFPRNQFNQNYLDALKEQGITSFRGNQDSILHSPRKGGKVSKLLRAFRLLDAYINLSGHHCFSIARIKKTMPFNIPASRFLRPYSSKLRLLETLKLRRIKKDLTFAAKHGLFYHLWWHPHNFGVNQDENLYFLRRILEHWQKLHDVYGFSSFSMEKLVETIDQKNELS